MSITHIYFFSFLQQTIKIEPFVNSGYDESSQSKSNKLCQYSGIFKVNANDKKSYGIHFPLLDIDKCTEDSFTLPSCFTAKGKRVIVRADLDDEYVAGQLYAYIIRVLYGEEGVKIGLCTDTTTTTTAAANNVD